MRIRIYDAMFETTNGSTHQHLGMFWWINETDPDSSKWTVGVWSTREQAYQEVKSLSVGSVYVKEGDIKVTVRDHALNGIHWIQTERDGISRDNLVTLAKRRAQGLSNR